MASSLRSWSGDISFRFGNLEVWGNQVLVARLRPADKTSERHLKDLSERRAALSKSAEDQLGVGFSQNYSPHISLGYFANEEQGQRAHACREHWTERFTARLNESIITYSSVRMYGFTDMISFFKITMTDTGVE